MRPSAHRVVVGLLLAVLTLGLAGCGEGDRVPETQPSPSGRFTEGKFDDIPLVPTSDPLTERSEKNDVTVQSYAVKNRTPEQIIEFYKEALEGWTMVGDVERGDNGAFYRARWRSEGFELLVSAAPAPTLQEGDEIRTQYSLSLSSP